MEESVPPDRCRSPSARSWRSAGTSSRAAAATRRSATTCSGFYPRPRPKVCLLPTASGDPADQIAAFRSSFAERECELSHLSLFRLEAEAVDVAEHLLTRDVIYVGGGSMLNLIAIWRAHGVDDLLRRCWERGIVLAGQSAGAMCWFEWGVSRSAGIARLVPGLGLVPGILSVHYHRDPERRQAMLAEVARRGRPGYGLDDGAGVLIRGDRVVGGAQRPRGGLGVAGGSRRTRPGARGPDGRRGAGRRPRAAIDEPSAEVLELRAVRALRAGRS